MPASGDRTNENMLGVGFSLEKMELHFGRLADVELVFLPEFDSLHGENFLQLFIGSAPSVVGRMNLPHSCGIRFGRFSRSEDILGGGECFPPCFDTTGYSIIKTFFIVPNNWNRVHYDTVLFMNSASNFTTP